VLSLVLSTDGSAQMLPRGWPQPVVGERAPDATVVETCGERIALSTFWKERPAVAVFLRHYG
jgi:hypothetical protein